MTHPGQTHQPTDPEETVEVQRGRDAAFVLNFRTLVLDDPALGVLRETSYWLRYADGSAGQGLTDAEGRLRVRTDRGPFVDIAIHAHVQTRAIRVMITREPSATPRGAWARLVNLGIVDMPEPPVDPTPEQLEDAVFKYQVLRGLRRSGELDEATQARLGAEAQG